MNQPRVASEHPRAPLVLTPGEPAGIGAEIAMKAWLTRDACGLQPFALIEDPDRLTALRGRLGWQVPIERVSKPSEAAVAFPRALPVLAHPMPVWPEPGRPASENGEAVLAAIDDAVRLVRTGECAALVTNPIAKSVLYAAGFHHPGHTEYLAELAQRDTGEPAPAPVMMLTCPELKVVPVTVHMPLKEVPARLTTEAIVHAGRVTATALARDFAIDRPRLAIAGLNPHAGENGALGREEDEIIAPALARLSDDGVRVAGPQPADTLFHAEARRRYDAALCMYHDQALVPLKTIDFARGVNVTLGLPFVRTSPDHGTAFNLAGTGKADATSLIEALKTARSMADARARAQTPQGPVA